VKTRRVKWLRKGWNKMFKLNIDWQYIDNMGFLAFVSFFAMALAIMLLEILNTIILKICIGVIDVGVKSAVIKTSFPIAKFVLLLVVLWIGVVVYCEVTGK
jgi:hypothetical protein